MRKKLYISLLTIITSVMFCLGIAACNGEQPANPTKLGAVTVTLEGNVAVWEEVPNASRYAYKINNGTEIETTLREVVLQDRQFIKVKAVGDGKYYSDGDYCISVTYRAPSATKLDTPELSREGNVISWTAVTGALRYAYVRNGGMVVETTARELILNDGDTIKVKAVGDGVVYKDSEYSALLTYTAPVVPEEPDDTDTPDAPEIPDTPAYDAIVVSATIDEGETITLGEIALTVADFTWKTPSTAVNASGYYAAYYKETIEAQVYVDLTIVPAPQPLRPDYATVVVKKTIAEGTTLTLGDIQDLPTGFAWKKTSTVVTESGYFVATYTVGDKSVNAQIYVDLTIIPKEVEVPTLPAYTTVVVTKTIAEGQSITLADVLGLPTGFAWKNTSTPVTESGYFDATYTDGSKTVSAQAYVSLIILPAEVPELPELPDDPETTPEQTTPAYTTIVVHATIQEGGSTWLNTISLPQGFDWVVPGGEITTSGYYAATYTDENGTVDAIVYVDLTIEPVQIVPTKLGSVTVSLKGHTASWTTVAGAARYAYQINDGAVVETTLTSIVLNAGDTIKVKAIGDGKNYSDGDYCAPVTHATIYDGPISEGPVAVTINALDTADSATATNAISYGVHKNIKAQGNNSYYIQYAQSGSVTIPMMRNGVALSKEKARLFSALKISVFVSGDDLWCDAALANAPTVKVGNQTFGPNDWKAGWNDITINLDGLYAGGYVPSVTIQFSRPVAGNYLIYFDNLAGVYEERLDLGNVMVFGDSYSTYDGYIRDPRFFYYADKPVSNTDVNSVTQTWWGQLIADTDSNLIMNDSIAGSTVSRTTYNITKLEDVDKCPQDNFTERMDMLISQGYFASNQVDTILMYGGTNDSWGGSPLGTAKYSGWTAQDLMQVLPSYCYFITKALANTDATIYVILNTYEIMSEPVISAYRPNVVDYQTAIINAVKGFAEYGTRIQIVALNNHEFNSPDTSIGSHPTVMGMGAIKDQIMHTMYERKYLSQDKWSAIGNVSAGSKGTTLNAFSSWDEANDPYMLGDATATLDKTTTADGNGSWAVKPTVAGNPSFVICHMTSDYSMYDKITLVVYANAAASGVTLYMNEAHTKAIGTLKEGINEFSIASTNVSFTSNQWGKTYFAVFFVASSTNATLYFDSLSGV